MTPGPIKSREWRDRAEEYRRFAEQASSPDGREAYLGIAANGEQIAVRLERLEAAEARRAQERS
ncbi:MAG: hypothetical protein JO021_25845 [Alphaproteobacteria bacterium]|nr:hypothetical protein [Alphaproteobacteria bacterium]